MGPSAISDTTSLNSTLFVTALNLVGLQGKPLSRDEIYYKGEIIEVVSERLGDPIQASSDGTMCPVAAVAHLDPRFKQCIGDQQCS